MAKWLLAENFVRLHFDRANARGANMQDDEMAACRQFREIVIERSSIFDRVNALDHEILRILESVAFSRSAREIAV